MRATCAFLLFCISCSATEPAERSETPAPESQSETPEQAALHLPGTSSPVEDATDPTVESYVGVWRIAVALPAEAGTFGSQTSQVWGFEVLPNGHFHLLHAGIDGVPIRQVGFHSEGKLNVGPTAEGIQVEGFSYATGLMPAVGLVHGNELTLQFYVGGNIRFERWTGQVQSLPSVPPHGAALGADGCSTPETEIVNTFGSKDDLMGKLVGRWALCSRYVNGSPESAGPAVIEVNAAGEYRELDAQGNLVPGPISSATLDIMTDANGAVMQVSLRVGEGTMFGGFAFSEAPRKLRWLHQATEDVLSRMP